MTLQTHIANARRIAEEARGIAGNIPPYSTTIPDLATQLEAALRVIEKMQADCETLIEACCLVDRSDALVAIEYHRAECVKTWEGK